MAEEYERTNARAWDETLQDKTNSRAVPTAQHQQVPPQPRAPLAAPQPLQFAQPQARGGGQRGHQHRPTPSQARGPWQGENVRVQRTRRVWLHSDEGRAMPKIAAQTEVLRANAEKKWHTDMKRYQFRESPLPHMAFESIGTFHWPSDEYRPDEVFGAKLEALDPIRMRTDCFITSSIDNSRFQVMGTIKGVQKALIALRHTCFQIASRNIPPVRKYVSHWRSEGPCLWVHLDSPYVNPRIISPAGEPLPEASKCPRSMGEMDDGSALEETKVREICGIEAVKATLAESLRKIHYLIGHIQFRIRLGTFVLVSWKGLEVEESWDLSVYEDMTEMAQFKGRVTEELGDTLTEASVFSRLQKAETLLLPKDVMQTKLSEMKASYTAEFVFQDDAGNLQLTMAWERNDDLVGGGFELLPQNRRWIRLDRDTGKATEMVDMILTDLHTGSAWDFDIKTSHTVTPDRVPGDLKQFHNGVKIFIKDSDELPVIKHESSHQRSLISIKVSAVYRYSIKATDYTLELSNYQLKEFGQRSTLYAEPEVKLWEPRWGLSVYRTDWDNRFSENERLKVSEKTKWKDEFEEWFPAEASFDSTEGDDGFKQLLERLGEIEKIVRDPVEEVETSEFGSPDVGVGGRIE